MENTINVTALMDILKRVPKDSVICLADFKNKDELLKLVKVSITSEYTSDSKDSVGTVILKFSKSTSQTNTDQNKTQQSV